MTDTILDIQKFLHDNKHLLFVIANPATDEIIVSYNDVSARSRFMKGMNVILGLLKKSRFEKAVDPFTTALLETLDARPDPETVQAVKTINGAIKAIGESPKMNMSRKARRSIKK